MTNDLLALRAAIVARCLADPTLAGLAAGGVRDEPPRGAAPVYALFGPSESRDVSGADGRLVEHDLTIRVWARDGSTATGLAAAARIATLLDDKTLALAGHHLVSLTLAATDTARDGATGLGRTVLRFRAVTEPA